MKRLTSGTRRLLGLGFVLGLVLVVGALPAAADTTAQTLPFAQNWANTGLITTNDDWAGVPGVVGYLGQDITTATATDPQTLLGESSVPNDVDVIANQTNTAIANGGVAEFQITDPVVALQGSGTGDAPYLLLNLNTTGFSSISVSYNLRDIDGTADNAVQPVALQYRVGSSGSFTNLPAAFVPDATTGPSLATLVTPVSATLPVAADSNPLVQVRVITTNAVGSDEWVGVDDISVSGTAIPGINLSVNNVSQSEGNSGTTTFTFAVSLSSPAGAGGVTFDIATADSSATSPSDFTASTLTGQTIPAGNSTATFNVLVNGDTAFEPDETFFVNVTNVTGATLTDGQGQGTIQNDDVDCAAAFTPISAIQGNGAATPIPGIVTTRGVVVGDYEGPSPTLRGFYLQSADADADATPATSEGIFVFNGSNNSVALGDFVYVTGTAAEFQDQTQISTVTSIGKCGTGTVTPADVTFPVASATFLEQYEGMLTRLPQTMVVTEHFQLGRFGQVVLSSDVRLQQPTNVVAPGAPALALQAANNLNRIILDDPSQAQNPDPILFARGGLPLSAANTLRGGDTATGIVGVMTYTWAGNAASGNAFRVRPINALGGTYSFLPANPRPTSAPAVGGTLKVAGMNLLNFFNTFDGLPDTVDNCALGVGGAAADCRGADTQAEFDRQWPKTVSAILAMNPDVLGVNEIENDGYGPASAMQFLVDRLNATTAPGTYALVDVDANTGQVNAMGTDAIKVGLLYKPAAVTPVGQTAALNTVAFVNGGDGAPRSRPSIAQAFQENATGARFIVDVNHLKSKGSACDLPDQGDGQGNCNQVRVNAANELTSWLASDPTGTADPDILLVGDYNSYAMEDPITAIKNAGYTNLIASLLGPNAYSYVFDGQWGYLDHALASGPMATRVTGVAEYHINSDEPSVLDYNTDFKTANLQSILYAPNEFRVSDHDPVIVGLSPNRPPTVDAGGPYSVFAGFSVAVSASGSDPDAGSLTYAWDLDSNGSFETPGQSATFSAASISTPGPRTIKVRVTDAGGLTAVDTATVNVVVTYASLCTLTKTLVTKADIAHALCVKLENAEAAAARGDLNARDGMLKAYRNQLDAQTGKSVSAANAALLKALSLSL